MQCSKRRTWVARAGERGEAYPTFDCDAPSSILGRIRPRPGMTACGGTSISLGAHLCHLAARLAHSGGCGIRPQPRVAENRAELVSLAETSNGRLVSSRMPPRGLARVARSRADGLDRGQHLRVLRIEGRRLPHAEREVRGSDIDTVETLDRDDLVEVLHGLARLDHGEDQNFVIRVLPIVGAAIEKRAVGAKTARAARRLAAGPHPR